MISRRMLDGTAGLGQTSTPYTLRGPLALNDADESKHNGLSDQDTLIKESTVKVMTKYMDNTDPYLLKICERENEDAYCEFAGKVYSFKVKDQRPLDLELSSHFEQLRRRRIAVHLERISCRALIGNSEGPLKALHDEIAVAEGKLRRLARQTEGMMNEFLTYVRRAYRRASHASVRAILDMPIGLHAVKQMLQLSRIEARTLRQMHQEMDALAAQDDEVDMGLGSTSEILASGRPPSPEIGQQESARAPKRPVMLRAVSQKSSRLLQSLNGSVFAATQRDVSTEPVSGGRRSNYDATASLAEDFMKTRALTQTFTPYGGQSGDLGAGTGPMSSTGLPKEVTPDVKAFLSVAVHGWEVASGIIKSCTERQADMAPGRPCIKLCRALQEGMPEDLGLLSEGALQVVAEILAAAPPAAIADSPKRNSATSTFNASSNTGNAWSDAHDMDFNGSSNNAMTMRTTAFGNSSRSPTAGPSAPPVPLSSVVVIFEDLCRVLEQFLLPIFLVSDCFVAFLQQGSRECAFGGKLGATTRNMNMGTTMRTTTKITTKTSMVKTMRAGTPGAEDKDAQGRRRVNGEMEEFMDTSVLHGGQQRAKVAIVYPQLLIRLKEVKDSIFEAQGKLPLLLEHIYTLAAPDVQRVWRGYRTRKFAKWTMKCVSKLAIYTCCLTIQRHGRGYIQRKRYRIQLPLWKSRRAISIQNIARQFLARKKVAGIHHEHLEGVKLQKVESIQKLWRRYRMRRQLEHWGGVRKRRLHELDRQWGALTIQRVYRGHFVRAMAVPNRCLELNLDHRLVQLGEQFLTDGDLRAFLQAANQVMVDSRSALDATHHNEDDRAETLTHRLKRLRDNEAERAWPRFSNALAALKRKEASDLAIAKQLPGGVEANRPAGEMVDLDMVLFKKAVDNQEGALEVEYGIKRRASFLHRPPTLNGPGVRVRQVMLQKAEDIVRMYGKQTAGRLTKLWRRYLPKSLTAPPPGGNLGGVEETAQARGEAHKLLLQLCKPGEGGKAGKDRKGRKAPRGFHDTSRSLWGDEAFADDLKARSPEGALPLAMTQRQHMAVQGGRPTDLTMRSGRRGGGRDLLPSIVAAAGKGVSTMRLQSTASTTLTTSEGQRSITLTNTRAIKTTPRGRHAKTRLNAMNLFHGDAVLSLPMGLDEPIERFLRCALLHASPDSEDLVNSASEVSLPTPANEYARYAALPPCLTKVQFERHAFAHAATLSEALRPLGIRSARDLLPLEARESVLLQAGMGPQLQCICADMLRRLHAVTLQGKYGKARLLGKYEAMTETLSSGGSPECNSDTDALIRNGQQAEEGPQVDHPSSEQRMVEAEEGPYSSAVVTLPEDTEPRQSVLDGLRTSLTFGSPALHLLAVAMCHACGWETTEGGECDAFLYALLTLPEAPRHADSRFSKEIDEVTLLADSLSLQGVATVADIMTTDMSAWTSNEELLQQVNAIKANLTASFMVGDAPSKKHRNRSTKARGRATTHTTPSEAWFRDASRRLRLLQRSKTYF